MVYNESCHRYRNLQSSILIWLTLNPDETKIPELRKIINYAKLFNDVDLCNKYIESVEDDDKIYVISNVPDYHSKKARIYPYNTADEESSRNFDEAINDIKNDYNVQLNPLGINIFKQSTHLKLGSEFLWFQFVIEELIDVVYDQDKAKQDLIEMYKQYFNGNVQQEENIQKFENTYRSENALQWYSR
ncbi:unnamed protein product [Didymodactylos carnosus]|uniref:Uncharacterized protein n=1 Tax=Didymodactylos carnosus TaxID=1234261 RepID=A0A815X002_9BILA|nr:unnamed protein product [Didymodactylos carnosus]CAF4412257.1 unnamed protein product [Didymodactylos carnosus]